MDAILILSKNSGQTQLFLRDLPSFLADTEPRLMVEFAFYPDYIEKIKEQPWLVIGISPELLIEEKEIRSKIEKMNISSPVKSIRGVHYGLRRFDLIFPALLAK